MSHKHIEIKEGAFVISDAHYSLLRPELLELFQKIEAEQLHPTQLILMGDIFDALFGEVPHTHIQNSTIIKTLQNISYKIEVIYLEGNHDFNLKTLFPEVRVVPLQAQPLMCHYKSKSIALAHGDFDLTLSYKLYTKLIRNSFILKVLSLVDRALQHTILHKLDLYLAKKDDCKEFIGFYDYVKMRGLERYACDIFIEGHYHQNCSFEYKEFSYINLAAFACNQRYFIVKSLEDKELLKEEKLSKET